MRTRIRLLAQPELRQPHTPNLAQHPALVAPSVDNYGHNTQTAAQPRAKANLFAAMRRRAGGRARGENGLTNQVSNEEILRGSTASNRPRLRSKSGLKNTITSGHTTRLVCDRLFLKPY